MPAVRKGRLGEAQAGVAAAAQTDSLRVMYTPPAGTRLTFAHISASRNGGAISAAELNGRAVAIVYVMSGDNEPQNELTVSIVSQQGFPQKLRVIGASFVGDARFGGPAVAIPLSYEVQSGDQIIIEVSPWVDSAGAVVASQAIVNLHGTTPAEAKFLLG